MPRPGVTTVLTALGFSAEVDRFYQGLRGQSGRELVRVAASMLSTPEELLDRLAPLLDVGIVRVENGVLAVEAPADAVRRMVAAEARRADRAHRRLDGIGEALRLLAADHARSLPTRADSVPLEGELLTGGSPVELVRALLRDSAGDLLWLRPDQWRGPQEPDMVDLVKGVVRAGRGSRALYPVRALHDRPEVLAVRIGAGEQVRVLPDLPTRLLVVRGAFAVLPEPLGHGDLPLSVVRQPGLVAAMAQWFEVLWERAAVPAIGPGGPRVDLRRFLLEQLACGAHDEQIARKLGISLRTVRRRVADLMSELGADSRFQAGVEAVRRGWV